MTEKKYYHIISVADSDVSTHINKSESDLRNWLQEIKPQDIGYTFFAFVSDCKIAKIEFKTTFEVKY